MCLFFHGFRSQRYRKKTESANLECFFESTGFEDAIRTAISIGGDSDTIAAITGSVAEAYYGVPSFMKESAICYLDKKLYSCLSNYRSNYNWWNNFLHKKK